MKHARRSFSIVLFALVQIVASAANGQPPGEADWQQLPDGSLGYATEFHGSGGTPIPAYIRKPKGPGKFPVVVLLHGGNASKEGTFDMGSRTTAPTGNFVAAGWAVYAIDFRPPDPNIQKLVLDDTLLAVATVRRMDFIDGGRMALMGGSRGGHVMSEVLSRVDARCAVLCSPAMIDLIEISKVIAAGAKTNPALNSAVKQLERQKGVSIQEIAKDPKKYAYESPLTEAPKARCPVMFINGANDTSSPLPVIEAYGKALRESGHDVESYTPEDAPHGFYFGIPRIPETDAAAKRAVAFIRKHFQ
jgi:dipeptidyl aminopeptidase/acylaminoacyl peptidase